MKKKDRVWSILLMFILIVTLQLHPMLILAEQNVEEFTLNKQTLSLQVGSKKKITAKATDEKITWESSKEKIATVSSDGTVTGRTAGTTVVTATSSTGATASCKVTVTNKIIRVLLKNTGFSSEYHGSITLTSNKKFTITNGKKTKSYGAGKYVTIKKSYVLLKGGKSLTIKAADNGKIKVISVSRAHGTPSYRGSMVVQYISGKGLTLVNHVPLEYYLYSVVGSEMSSSFSKEALKAQAVTARSFAYANLNSSKYANLKADVDDSTSYQVYNNTKEETSVISAVNATQNMVIKSGKDILKTYFFSTSFGETSLPSEVWNGDGEDKYYNNVEQLKNGDVLDLSSNEKFQRFIKVKSKEHFDRNADWYRWSAEVTKANMQKQINGKLSLCYTLYPAYIKTKQSNGSYKSVVINSVGTLKNVGIISRTKSGMVEKLKITGSKATIQVSNASAVRMLMAPTYDVIEKNNGSKVSGYTMLPSAYFTIAKTTSGGAVKYAINGGGYGHNVGMSQNGANQMAKEGYDYQDILKHYYKNINISHIVDE